MGTGKVALPKYSNLSGTFFGSQFGPGFVALAIGGKVHANFADPKQKEYKNTCALRVSRSLNYAGAKLKAVKGVRMNSGRDGFWYIYSVNDLERYLRHMYGQPDIDKKSASLGGVTSSDFAGAQGIILFKNYHSDLWNGTTCQGHCYFSEVREVMLWRAP